MKNSEYFWDKIADKYDKAEERFETVHAKILQSTKKYLNLNDIILDYGCATGSKAFQLAGDVKEIHGIDISSRMIEIAQRRLADSQINNIRFTRSTIFDDPLKKESFNVVMAFAILHSLENNHHVMQRIAELLKPGGLFISTTPCFKEKMDLPNKLNMYFTILLSKTGLIPLKINRYQFSDLDNLFLNADFSILETEKFFYQMSSYFVVAKKG